MAKDMNTNKVDLPKQIQAASLNDIFQLYKTEASQRELNYLARSDVSDVQPSEKYQAKNTLIGPVTISPPGGRPPC